MARSKPKLTVRVAPEATAEVADIWCWNAERYSPDHADRYIDFLKHIIAGLALSYASGKPVETRRDLRYLLIRRKPKGYGHLIVYRFDEKIVEVVHVFHSAQDWQTKLITEDPAI